MLLMALLGVTFGTLSILAATVASFKAVGDGAEVRVLICTLTGETTLTLLRCTAFVRQELFMGSVWGVLVHNAGIKWFVVVWPTVLTSCTAEIPGLDDKAILVEYNVLEVPKREEKKNNHSKFIPCYVRLITKINANIYILFKYQINFLHTASPKSFWTVSSIYLFVVISTDCYKKALQVFCSLHIRKMHEQQRGTLEIEGRWKWQLDFRKNLQIQEH